MADFDPENEDQTNELEIDTGVEDHDAPETEEPQDEAPEPAEDDGDLEIEIEGEDGGEDEPHLVKQLRNELRERDRKLAELQKQPVQIEVGPKPTLEGCDYDEDRYTADLEAWYETKRQADNAEADNRRRAEQQNEQFNKAVSTYRAEAARKGIRNIEEAERAVAEAISPEMTGLIVQYSKGPELVIAALHRHPAKLNAIAAETDPIRRMRMIWDLESKVKPTMKRTPPPPAERGSIVQGSTAPSLSRDKQLEKLEAEADRTGDRSKLIAYRAANK